jgi:asparagine N-glycosylation enzyme membrane subunit Stt3
LTRLGCRGAAALLAIVATLFAAWSFVGLKTALWHRLASCVLGAITVGLVGLLGRRLAGDRAGLIAAVLAAFRAACGRDFAPELKVS